MIARPSRPSVRLTALEKPTIQKEATTTKNTPSGIATFFSSGTKNVVEADTVGSAVRYRNMPAASPNSDCNRYFQRDFRPLRSEEHTSELQSLMRISYAVFCLKKKKKTQQTSQRTIMQTLQTCS